MSREVHSLRGVCAAAIQQQTAKAENPLVAIPMSKRVGRTWIHRFQEQQRNNTLDGPHAADMVVALSSLPPGEEHKSDSIGPDSTSPPTKACDAENSTSGRGVRFVDRYEDLKFNLFRNKHLRNSTSQFHIDTFLFEFFTHLFYPLSIPVVLGVQGTTAAVNKGFIPGKPVFKGQVLYTLLFLAPIIFVSVRESDVTWAASAVVIGALFTAFRMLVTAGKYASFRRSKYWTVVHCDYDCVKDLLLATIVVEPETIEALIDEAERDSGIRLSDMWMLLADGVTSVNARVYATALTRTVFTCAESGNDGWHRFVRTALGFVASLYPLERFLSFCPTKDHPASIVFLIVLMFQTTAYASIVFGFLGYAILYYCRMKALKCAHVSSLLFTGSPITSISVDPENEEDLNEEEGDLAMIPACSAKNIIAWATVGNVFSHFGVIINRRICFNFVANLIVCLFLAGALVLQAWVSTTSDPGFVSIVSFIFGVTALGMFASVATAYFANRSDDQVIKKLEEENFAYLWRERMRREQQTVTGKVNQMFAPFSPHRVSASDEERLSQETTYMPFLALENHQSQAIEYREAMEIVRELIQRRNEMEPLRVMYVGASIELVSFFASLVASGAMLIAGTLYQTVPWKG